MDKNFYSSTINVTLSGKTVNYYTLGVVLPRITQTSGDGQGRYLFCWEISRWNFKVLSNPLHHFMLTPCVYGHSRINTRNYLSIYCKGFSCESKIRCQFQPSHSIRVKRPQPSPSTHSVKLLLSTLLTKSAVTVV